ncbi:MAG: hypothetical protein AAFX87_21975 [Bacteroidota bacterium]
MKASKYILISILIIFTACEDSNELASVAPGVTGVGGSLARFAVSGDRLYTVDNQSLNVFDVTNPAETEKVTTAQIGFGIETIFPKGDKLFIGAQAGMFIYDIADPDNPQYISEYQHVVSCDPVVVEGKYAYVTLRSGNNCQRFTNVLQVVDIEDLSNPFLVAEYQMHNPHGLGIDQGVLFLCDGDDGLKVFDASDPLDISNNQVAHFDDIHAYDVIPFNGQLMLVGNDGLAQYLYDQEINLDSLSFIAAQP